jgi:hypothetical protein
MFSGRLKLLTSLSSEKRRHILGLGAVGVAGALLSPPALGSASGSDGVRRLLLQGSIVLTLDRSVGDFVGPLS